MATQTRSFLRTNTNEKINQVLYFRWRSFSSWFGTNQLYDYLYGSHMQPAPLGASRAHLCAIAFGMKWMWFILMTNPWVIVSKNGSKWKEFLFDCFLMNNAQDCALRLAELIWAQLLQVHAHLCACWSTSLISTIIAKHLYALVCIGVIWQPMLILFKLRDQPAIIFIQNKSLCISSIKVLL